MEGKNYKFPVRTIAYSQHIDLRASTIPTEMKRAARAGKAEARTRLRRVDVPRAGREQLEETRPAQLSCQGKRPCIYGPVCCYG